MINLSPPKFFTHFFPRLLWRMPNSSNTIYLTFDDGPTQGVTPWVLDTLKKYNAKATFFCLGKNVERHPHIFQRIIDEGHAVGNHSYSHLKGWETPTSEYVQDVDLANDILNTKLFRPPYGRIKSSQTRILTQRYKIVMWSLLSMDYSRWVTPKRCAKMVVNKLHPGAIIVFHDSVKAEANMRHALVEVLEELRRRSWGFGVVE